MFTTISMKELETYIENKMDIVILDIRNRASYEYSHISGALSIPFQQLEQGYERLPKDKMIVIYCSRGGQSMMACRYLSEKGYHVVNVANGIFFYHGKYLIR